MQPQPDGSTVITIEGVDLPPGWSRERVAVRIVVPVGYPAARPDSFWTDADLRTQNGAAPMNTNVQQPWPGEGPYLWFSWHPAEWNPHKDSLVSYLGVVMSRLNDPR